MKNSDAILQKEEELIRLIKTSLENHFGSSFNVGLEKSYLENPYTRCIKFKRNKDINKIINYISLSFEFELTNEDEIRIIFHCLYDFNDDCFTSYMGKRGFIKIKDLENFIKRISVLVNQLELFDTESKMMEYHDKTS